MKHSTTLALALAAAVMLSGCSSFKLGAFCYAPAVGGQCTAAAVPVVDAQTAKTE
ncbi:MULTISPECIES: hypothetical protein [unclassified Acidovorax]|uniref:hypothetical protein n=1 Tax=unclassified Acidovorax TaxID=2684926 RepID=UPI001C44813E|nr:MULTISPECIES: hypothetical protein [unclassified Acidovorax]MBV7459501.1 hypothetical protein [Acidovorax sp. sif0632]MBV7464526.1 hypothetical protein [Acidovorax sp. sif0613]